MPRINFVSFTFLFAFGLGAFAGTALSLLAVALATPEPEPTIIQPDPAAAADVPPTLTPSPTLTVVATATPTPVPTVSTRATLNVHVGPDEDYAVLGTLAGGSEIAVQGRDDLGDWVAIQFPPGSSARGWIPAGQVDGLSLTDLFELDILQATLIDTTPRLPFSTPSAPSFDGSATVPTPSGSGVLPPLQGTTVPTPTTTTPHPGPPTPRPTSIGPTDLAIAGVEVISGGRLRIVVENLGPGDVPGLTVEVSAAGYATETLASTNTLRAGDTVVFVTGALQLNAPALVRTTIDPDNLLTDLDRTNNSLRLDLEPLD